MRNISRLKAHMALIVCLGFYAGLNSGCSVFHRIKSNGIFVKATIDTANFYQEIDFKVIHHLPVFEVSIEGNKYRFIFDTGGYTVLSEKVMKSLNDFKQVSYIDVKDGNGETSRINTYVLDELVIGGIGFSNVGFAKIGFTEADWFTCLGIDGTIGPNIMKECLWLFDNESNKLVFTDKPARLPIISEGIAVPIKTDNVFKPSIDFSIGNHQADLGFDTGFNGFLSFRDRAGELAADSFPFIEKVGDKMNAGHGAVISNTKVIKLDAININGLQLGPCVANASAIASSNALGSRIFENHNVLFDLTNKKCYFQPFEAEIVQDKIESFGFGLDYKDNKLVIGYVYLPSRAMDMGIRPGQEISKINGKEWSFSSYCDFVDNFDLPSTEYLELEITTEIKTLTFKLKKEILL